MTSATARTKLILIEGLPGSGKSTTTARLGESLTREGQSCKWYSEEYENHPIDLRGIPLTESSALVRTWETFVHQAKRDESITVMESRLWQSTALFKYMAGIAVEEIVEQQEMVSTVLGSLSPTLIYLFQPDVRLAFERLRELRDETWWNEVLEKTSRYAWFRSRDKNDFDGWVDFFTEWLEVAEILYQRWPHSKVKVENPHDDWDRASATIDAFLEDML
jgi:thymidylate kinase